MTFETWWTEWADFCGLMIGSGVCLRFVVTGVAAIWHLLSGAARSM